MNIANVTDRFAVLAELESSEVSRWSPVVEVACRYVQSLCTVEVPDSGQTARLETLAAVYAFALYEMCGNSRLTQFVAGDVRLTSSADNAGGAWQLWKEMAKSNADLIRGDDFIFGRVI